MSTQDEKLRAKLTASIQPAWLAHKPLSAQLLLPPDGLTSAPLVAGRCIAEQTGTENSAPKRLNSTMLIGQIVTSLHSNRGGIGLNFSSVVLRELEPQEEKAAAK